MVPPKDLVKSVVSFIKERCEHYNWEGDPFPPKEIPLPPNFKGSYRVSFELKFPKGIQKGSEDWLKDNIEDWTEAYLAFAQGKKYTRLLTNKKGEIMTFKDLAKTDESTSAPIVDEQAALNAEVKKLLGDNTVIQNPEDLN